MYSKIITWFKTYSDLYLKAYYDDFGDPKWFSRELTSMIQAKNDDEDNIPSGMCKSLYTFTFQFFTNTSNPALLTTAFENLISDLTNLYIFDNPITFNTTSTLIIRAMKHVMIQDAETQESGYRLDIDIETWGYIT